MSSLFHSRCHWLSQSEWPIETGIALHKAVMQGDEHISRVFSWLFSAGFAPSLAGPLIIYLEEN